MEPAVVVPVYYDFASTIAYVGHRVTGRMTDVLGTLGLALDWRPVDLAALLGWPRDLVVDGPRRANALRVARDLDVAVRMPPRWLDSRSAHAVALALGGRPKAVAWRERVWTAVFEEGRPIDDPAELVRLGADLDLDVAAVLAAADGGALADATRHAAARGVTGVPTFLLDAWPMGGIQEEATMRALFERFLRKRAQAGGSG